MGWPGSSTDMRNCWRRPEIEPPCRRFGEPPVEAQALALARLAACFGWLTETSVHHPKMAQSGIGANNHHRQKRCKHGCYTRLDRRQRRGHRLTPVETLEQPGRTRPPSDQAAHPSDEGVQILRVGQGHHRRHRDRAHDQEGAVVLPKRLCFLGSRPVLQPGCLNYRIAPRSSFGLSPLLRQSPDECI
jgi:hypothetical protein